MTERLITALDGVNDAYLAECQAAREKGAFVFGVRKNPSRFWEPFGYVAVVAVFLCFIIMLPGLLPRRFEGNETTETQTDTPFVTESDTTTEPSETTDPMDETEDTTEDTTESGTESESIPSETVEETMGETTPEETTTEEVTTEPPETVCPHDYKASVKEATCTKKGARTYTCSLCGDSYTEKIAAKGHDYVLTATKEPTCVTEGEKRYTCSRCDGTKTWPSINTMARPVPSAVCLCPAKAWHLS